MSKCFPVGVLARTERGSTIPFLDDLSHHMLVVASANLSTNSPEAVLASLMHDMFKGLMIWTSGARGVRWKHFSTRTGFYEKLIPSHFKINPGQVSDFIRIHHDRLNTQNPIKHIEEKQDSVVTSLESRFILNQIPANTNALVLKLSGRYRWLLAFYVHRFLKQQLTARYRNKFNSILGVRSIHYHYRPANLSQPYPDIDSCLHDLGDIQALQLKQNNDGLHIYLPVQGLASPITIAYGDYDALSQDQGILQVPFGEALSLMAFDGTSAGKAKLLYIDGGFTVALDNVVEQFLNEALRNPSRIGIPAYDIARSLEGVFKGPERCSFCGEPANSRLRLQQTSRFTSIQTLLDPRLNICPACRVGYELEEQLRIRKGRSAHFMIPLPALVDKIELGPSFSRLSSFIKGDNYLMSLSGELWLQILSRLWYRKYQENQDADYILDPKAALLPLEIEFIPQGMYPLLQAPKKKFALESSLSSSLVLPAENKDIDANEFRALRNAYCRLGVKASSLLKRFKQIYEPLY